MINIEEEIPPPPPPTRIQSPVNGSFVKLEDLEAMLRQLVKSPRHL